MQLDVDPAAAKPLQLMHINSFACIAAVYFVLEAAYALTQMSSSSVRTCTTSILNSIQMSAVISTCD